MSTSFARRLALILISLALLLAPHGYAAQRTFVSTTGADSNACSLTAPCRTFGKAILVTDVGGEIVVLDSGGYGGVTVNKNVTILSPSGVYAGLSVFAGNDGITVASPATKVVLRGLTINGQGGNNGVRIQAGEVHLESLVIANLTQAGILIEGGSSVRVAGTVVRSNAEGLHVVPTSGTVNVVVRESEFSNQTGAGVDVMPSGSGVVARVTVEHSSATKNAAGFAAAPGAGASAMLVVNQSVTSENAGAGISSSGAGATVYVRESAITRNNIGLAQTSSGVLNACGANLLAANNTAQSGSINTGSCLDVASGSGTVTSVATGAGLTGGPVTSSGTINLASTQLLPTAACASNQIPKWNGSAWTCAADNAGPANAFVQGGNAFGVTAVLGTTDAHPYPLELHVANARALRIEPPGYAGYLTPNIIGGSPINTVTAGTSGATIAGGGSTASFCGPSGTSPCANAVTSHFGTVGGGWGNTADEFGTVAGGQHNTASGAGSAVPGGENNIASGILSFAAGINAKATHNRSFVWGGDPVNDTISIADGDFVVYAPFQVRLYAGPVGGGGCVLSNGTTGWQCASDRNLKENFTTLDTRDVLRRLSAIPITSWNAKVVPGVRHIGPMAQDFYAAFGLGDSELHIGTTDAQGVALAAIQGLHQLVQEKDLETHQLLRDKNAKIETQQREIAELKERLVRVESLRDDLAALRSELADFREPRTQITARE
jgi:hypothetical protein